MFRPSPITGLRVQVDWDRGLPEQPLLADSNELEQNGGGEEGARTPGRGSTRFAERESALDCMDRDDASAL